MAIKYGNESQFTMFAPDCGFFAQHAAAHYVLVVYEPLVQTFAIVVNTWIIALLVGGGGALLQQSQHVYVLGSAITNVLFSGFGILGFWLDQYVIPCIAKSIGLCAFKNLFFFGGGYQVVLNVCLVCYDRYRLVTIGAKYLHAHEVKRAKVLLMLTGCFSALLFVVPEIVTPVLTGQMFQSRGADDVHTRCVPSGQQPVAFLLGQSMVDVLGIVMVVVPFGFALTFSALTALKLWREQRKAAQTKTASQLANSRKLVRASLIMFGMVTALLVTWGPYAVFLIMIQVKPDAWFSMTVLMGLVSASDSAPAFDPFVFALTLPKLRARAQQTKVGRMALGCLTFILNKTNTSTTTVSRLNSRVAPAPASGNVATTRAVQRREAENITLSAVAPALPASLSTDPV